MTFWVKGLGAEQDYKQYRFSLSIHRSLYFSVVSEVSLLYEFMKEHVLTILDSLDSRWNVLVEDVMCWIRTKVSILCLRNIIMALRGSSTLKSEADVDIPDDFIAERDVTDL